MAVLEFPLTASAMVCLIFLLPVIVSSHSGIEVIHHGDACECCKALPYQVQIPEITECRDAHYDCGYKIVRPAEKPAEVKYSFDFHMERPKPDEGIQL